MTLAVGDTFGPLTAGPTSRSTLALFAGGSGDHNEIHLDIDIAKAGGMPDVFAQGMLSMAYLGRLLTDSFGQAAIVSFENRFTSITPVNVSPVCTGQVSDITDGIATIDLKTALEDGTPTLVGQARIKLDAIAA